MDTHDFPPRKELISRVSVMNQLRNAVYHLQRFLTARGVQDLKPRLIEMGRNIGETYSEALDYKKTKFTADLKELYEITVHSKVKLQLNQETRTIDVIDSKCALCKYNYEDIDIAGCYVIMGMIERLMNKIGYKNFHLLDVLHSKTCGDEECIHQYKIQSQLKEEF